MYAVYCVSKNASKKTLHGIVMITSRKEIKGERVQENVGVLVLSASSALVVCFFCHSSCALATTVHEKYA